MEKKKDYSIILVRKIMRVLEGENSIGRTSLAQAANVHYSRLTTQLSWLQHKQYVVIELQDGKVMVRLTDKGKKFATKLSMLEDDTDL